MNLVRQPGGSSLCGQACVAMVAGVTLDAAIEAVGHARATKTADIVRGLRSLGACCAPRLRRVSRNRVVLPPRAIVAVSRWVKASSENDVLRCRRAHWMVTWDGVIYDPEDNWPDLYERNNWLITSYLEVQ